MYFCLCNVVSKDLNHPAQSGCERYQIFQQLGPGGRDYKSLVQNHVVVPFDNCLLLVRLCQGRNEMPVSADSSNTSSLLEKSWFSMDLHALNSYYQDRNDYCSFLCCRLYNPYFCWHYTRKGLKFQDVFVVIFSVLAGLYNLGYITFLMFLGAKTRKVPKSVPAVYRNIAKSEISETERGEWDILHGMLEDKITKLGINTLFKPFGDWAGLVGRFSFQYGRANEHQADESEEEEGSAK